MFLFVRPRGQYRPVLKASLPVTLAFADVKTASRSRDVLWIMSAI